MNRESQYRFDSGRVIANRTLGGKNSNVGLSVACGDDREGDRSAKGGKGEAKREGHRRRKGTMNDLQTHLDVVEASSNHATENEERSVVQTDGRGVPTCVEGSAEGSVDLAQAPGNAVRA